MIFSFATGERRTTRAFPRLLLEGKGVYNRNGKGEGGTCVFALPQVGQVVNMKPVLPSCNGGGETYKSRVADVDEETIAIEVPIQVGTGRTGTYAEGAEWIVWYVAVDGARMEFRAPLVGTRDENIRLWLIGKPDREHMNRVQRRHFVRVSAEFEIAVKLNDKVRGCHFLARTVDVSGGGLAFVCPDRHLLREGDQLDLWLCLAGKAGAVAHARAAGEVVRVNVPDEPGQDVLVSVKFTDISEGDRAKVIRACFERQLEMRKKRLAE